MMKLTVLGLACLTIVSSLYCASICAANTYVDCSTTGPSSCTLCDSTYFLGGGCLAGPAAGLAFIQYASEANSTVLSLWSTNSVNTNQVCIKSYSYAGYGAFTYNFYKRLVGGDYLYRAIPINVPHFQLKLKFSIAFVGVWSRTTDFILMHLDDTLQTYNVNLSYLCDSSNNGTERLCNVFTPNSVNTVDCFQYYDQIYNHNTTKMIVNFTSLSNQRDSSDQFWNLYDILVAVVTCHPFCRTCYNTGNTNCFSCSDNYYYVDNNTCQSPCPLTLPYILPAPTNSLTGNCVAQCPQGFYLSGTTCAACPTYCIACINANTCTVFSTIPEDSLWKEYITLWVILIILGVILLVGVFYRLLCVTVPIHNEKMAMIPEEAKGVTYEDRVTINQTYEQPDAHNFHIQEIDFKDNVLVDQNPRKRKRLQRDMNRTRGTSLA